MTRNIDTSGLRGKLDEKILVTLILAVTILGTIFFVVLADAKGEATPPVKQPQWSYSTTGTVNAVAVSGDGQHVVAGTSSNYLYLFNAGSSIPITVLTLDFAPNRLMMNYNGSVVIGTSGNKVFCANNTGTALSLAWTYTTGGSVVSAIKLSDDSRYVAVGTSKSGYSLGYARVNLFDANNGTLLWDYITSSGYYESDSISVDISSNGEYIVAGSTRRNEVYLFNKTSSTPLYSYNIGSSVNSVSITGDGQYLIAGGDKIYYFRRETGVPLWSINTGGTVTQAFLSNDSTNITAVIGTTIYFLNNNGSTQYWTYSMSGSIGPLYFSENDRYFTTYSGYRVYYFSTIASGLNRLLWVNTTQNNINSVSISSNAKYVGVGSGNAVYLFAKGHVFIVIDSPKGYENWSGGSNHTITYTVTEGISPYIVNVSYSENGGLFYEIDKISILTEGTYSYNWLLPFVNTTNAIIKINVTDGLNDTASNVSNIFTIDSMPPTVLSTTPLNGATNIPLRESIVIQFNESMNTTSVQNALSIMPEYVGLIYNWSDTNDTLTISMPYQWAQWNVGTIYTITINNTAKDNSNPGNYMVANYTFNFTTRTVTTIYVDDSGGAEYTSIEAALCDSTGGDTIYVYNGTYNESVRIQNKINLVGESKETTTINGSITIGCSYVNISGFTLRKGGVAILLTHVGDVSTCVLVYSNNNAIQNCNICGILFYSASNNYITNCAIHSEHCGILLYSSSNNNQITNCTIYNNSYGIYLYSSSNNKITNCTVYNNFRNGIELSHSSNNNQISNCAVYNNFWNGIELSHSSNGNAIYHNNFININNAKQSYDHGSNSWDDGVSKGNYWSDYTGTDSDGDGIGDTPYTSPDGYIQDHFPLIRSILGIGPQVKFLRATITANPSTIYFLQSVTINIHVTNGTDPFPNATIQLSDNGAGGSFSSVIDYGNGNYTSTYNAPAVSAQTNVTITVNVSKTDYIGCQRTIQVMVKPVLPDLTLSASDIKFSKENIVSGDTILITVTIHNDGLANANNVQVSFYDDTRLIGSRIVNVSAGASMDVSIEWSIGIFDIGAHDIKVVVNQYNIIVEELTTNNEAKIKVSVGLSPLIYGSIIVLICIIIGIGFLARVRTTKKLKKKAFETIITTQSVLEEAKKLGLDTKEGEALLEKAKKEMERR